MTDGASNDDDSLLSLLRQLAEAPQGPGEPPPGTRVGRFELIKTIGRGGFGVVYEALDTELGRRVAIELMHRARAAQVKLTERLRREAAVVAQLNHENIVTLYDYGAVEGVPYLVLELLRGETLEKRLLRTPQLTLAEATRIAVAIARGLDHAHRASVIHRDLKPSNVFLTETGGVKVLDFGISKVLGSQVNATEESVLVGTPKYMSPEQASGRNDEVDQRTDVFALGAILYEMLAGRPAFSGQVLSEVVFRIVYGQPDPLARSAPAIPAAVIAAVERALAKDPAARFPDMKQLIAAVATTRPARPARDAELLLADCDEGFTLASYRNVFISIWRQQGTMVRLARVRVQQKELIAASRRMATLTFFEAGAFGATMDRRTQDEAMALVRDFAPSTIAALYVFEGTGLRAATSRVLLSAVNLAARASYPNKVFSALGPGVRWLAQNLDGIDPTRLTEAVEQARLSR